MNTDSDSSKPHCVADALGLGFLDDGEEGADSELLRDLYGFALSKSKPVSAALKDHTFIKKWINLEADVPRGVVSSLVALDDSPDLKGARRAVKLNLEAQSWNDILEIEMPPIQCQVKIHGSKWGYRFRDARPCKRGDEILNEDLPPIPNKKPSTQKDSCSAPTQETQVTPDSILKEGGMPC